MAEPELPTNNITNFVTAFAGGGVRTNLFKVSGAIPGYTPAQPQEELAFLIKAAQIPASSLGTIEIPYRGRRIKIPGDRTFQDWSITVLSDTNMSLRSAFENWSAIFNGHTENIAPATFMESMPTWSVTQLNRDGSGLRTYSFVGCFPSEVGSIDLSFENNDAIAEFPVTLNYSWWVAAPGGSPSASSSIGNIPTVGGSGIGQQQPPITYQPFAS